MATITVSNLMSWMEISSTTSNEEDASLTYAVNAANDAVTAWCGRVFDATTTASASARTYHPRSYTLCVTDDFWTTTGLIVKTDAGDDGVYETTLTLNTDFIVEPVNGIEDGITVPYRRIRATSWLFSPTHVIPPVQVTAAWGWATIPDEVTQATLIKAARIFKRRTSPEGVLGGWADFGAVRITNREDPDVVALLAPYRRAERTLYT